jgi:DNA mismatch repair protein MutH
MQNIKELLDLCQKIAGITIYELANMLNIACTASLKSNKGWIGQLLELYLGAKSYNLPIPDFPELGVELKTIPVNMRTLTPTESTYICTAPLNNLTLDWKKSIVYKKLAKILWIPIESSPKLSLSNRRIGKSFLWQPNEQQAIILKNDWYELTEMLGLGKLQLLSAKYGSYLQVRPKAANCKTTLISYKTIDGGYIKTVARGFYLRASFTKQILAEHFINTCD